MNPLSTRICKRRVPQRPPPDPHQSPSVSRRRSSRIESRQHSVSIPHILGLYYESQGPLKERPTDPQTSQPVRATSYTLVPTSNPIDVSVPSITQLQEYPSPSQTYNHQTRKRRPDRSIETGAPKRARLTTENLKAFEKPSYSETKPTRSKQSTSMTDIAFPDTAFQNGILNPICSKPPVNLKSRQERINKSRSTASPSESDYQHFASAIRRTPNDASVLVETATHLLKRYDDPGYQRSYNQAFTSFPKNIGFNNDLSAAQPDMVEGLDMPEFDPFLIREQLGGAATVYSGPQATNLPHLAGEWKGPGKNMISAQTQAGYDGACMIYGRNEARSFLESPDPAGHAFISTFTTDGTTLNIFDHYSSESQGQVKYHQYPTSNSFLISTYEDFKKIRRQLRNLEDDAKEASEKLRDELNEKWCANHRSPVSPNVPVEAGNSIDSNNHDYDDDEDPNN
ncbi:hypothetical protein BKA61DRAFT_644320 [Leptodontidium sp. MPI-SDFR-AT-0119]|nr:hypothetical protein BKA61DRAFT_644320 [Leptodontidium sp. MPI-SDFR-AT-0119]